MLLLPSRQIKWRKMKYHGMNLNGSSFNCVTLLYILWVPVSNCILGRVLQLNGSQWANHMIAFPYIRLSHGNRENLAFTIHGTGTCIPFLLLSQLCTIKNFIIIITINLNFDTITLFIILIQKVRILVHTIRIYYCHLFPLPLSISALIDFLQLKINQAI